MFRRLALKKITEIANLRSTCCAMMLLDSTDAYRLIILSSLAHPSFPRKSLQFLQFFTFVLLALQVAYSWLTQGSFRDLAYPVSAVSSLQSVIIRRSPLPYLFAKIHFGLLVI